MTQHKIIASSPHSWQNLIGIKYALTDNQGPGLNCYGLVREIYNLLNVELPVRTEESLTVELIAMEEGRDWIKTITPKAFDVALMKFKRKGGERLHLGILTPAGGLLHASERAGQVVHSDLARYQPYIISWYHYTGDGGTECLPPAGSGDMGRTIGSLLIAVAAMAFAPMTMGASVPFGWGELAGGMLYGAMGVSMAINIVGGLVVNALFPSTISGSTPNSIADSQNYNWDGIYNNARQGSPIPIILGTIRYGGTVLTENTWTDPNDKNYLDMLLCPCRHRISTIEEVQINDTEAEYYKGITLETRHGDDEQTLIDIFNKIYINYSSSAKIPYDASDTDPEDVVYFSSKGQLSAFVIKISAANGLWYMPEDTPIRLSGSMAIPFRIQYKRHTETAWTDMTTYSPGNIIPFTWQDQGVFTYDGSGIHTLTHSDLDHADCSMWWEWIPTQQFALIDNDGTQYYCTVITSGYTDPDGYPYVQFYAYTDAGRTVHKTSVMASGTYSIAGKNFEVTTCPASPPSGVTEHYITFRMTADSYGFRAKLKPGVNWSQGLYGTQEFAIYYKETTTSSWTHWLDVERKGVYPSVTIQPELTYGTYDFCIYFKSDTRLAMWQNWAVILDDLQILSTAEDTEFSIEGSQINATNAVMKAYPSLFNLEYDYYDFRVWRTKDAHDDVRWSDDIYVGAYAEIIEEELAYCGLPLIGIRVQATDRLSGSRPTVTGLITGEPLSVPEESKCHSAVISEDLGIMPDGSPAVNGIDVVGMRKLALTVTGAWILPAMEPMALGTANAQTYPEPFTRPFYWMVFDDSDGYAQTDRLLTKYYKRVNTLEDAGSGVVNAYLYNDFELDADTPVTLFSADDAPVDNTAWCVAKLLIDGSGGRITEDKIDWTSFSGWNDWNEEMVPREDETLEKRHKLDAVIDFQSDLWSTALELAKSARGILIPGTTYRVVPDKPDVHRQVFTEANTKNVSLNLIPRSERANILTVSFLDEDLNYAQHDISEKDVRTGERPIVKQLNMMIGVTRESQVRRILRWMLALNRFVDRKITFEANTESLEVQVGDVFLFGSRVLNSAINGRIREKSGDNLILDQNFTPVVGTTYRLSIWGDDQIYQWEGTFEEGETNEVPCPTGFDPGALKYEYNFILADVEDQYTKYRALNIQRSGSTRFATITALEYPDVIYGAEWGYFDWGHADYGYTDGGIGYVYAND